VVLINSLKSPEKWQEVIEIENSKVIEIENGKVIKVWAVADCQGRMDKVQKSGVIIELHSVMIY